MDNIIPKLDHRLIKANGQTAQFLSGYKTWGSSFGGLWQGFQFCFLATSSRGWHQLRMSTCRCEKAKVDQISLMGRWTDYFDTGNMQASQKASTWLRLRCGVGCCGWQCLASDILACTKKAVRLRATICYCYDKRCPYKALRRIGWSMISSV